jgi:hypothetical protein
MSAAMAAAVLHNVAPTEAPSARRRAEQSSIGAAAAGTPAAKTYIFVDDID